MFACNVGSLGSGNAGLWQCEACGAADEEKSMGGLMWGACVWSLSPVHIALLLHMRKSHEKHACGLYQPSTQKSASRQPKRTLAAWRSVLRARSATKDKSREEKPIRINVIDGSENFGQQVINNFHIREGIFIPPPHNPRGEQPVFVGTRTSMRNKIWGTWMIME